MDLNRSFLATVISLWFPVSSTLHCNITVRICLEN